MNLERDMLILAGKPGAKFVVGEGEDMVTVKIHRVSLRDSQVYLAFDAPRHVPVDREKVRESKEQDNAD